ncbi:adenylosuccinate lyase [Peptococcaceae bacterium]|nr:adenylosuccinate lyase [Peptococcaceae bacterium]MCL0052041.1 adenylosuccinate lyase [Peptococcaceae bacterium]
MIERYTLPEMKEIWSEENKFRKWLDVEIYACEALCKKGVIPESALKNIKEKANFSIKRILEIEEKVHHEVIAFLTCVAEYVGEDSKYIHLGLTSSDVVDTAQSVRMKEAADQILKRLARLYNVLIEKAIEYRNTVMIGRTHGIHAEPMTFGLKMLLWVAETKRNIERMKKAKEVISVGKISGAVGTYANIDPYVEEFVCRCLGLKPAPISTQVLQRDRHAEYMNTIAVIGCTLEKIATEIRALQRTDIREVEEFFAKGQKGSSAMPHKRNPIISERISGMARILRGNALAAMENVALWHERDISHSSVERVIIPDSTTLLDYMLYKITDVIQNLIVYPENMKKNMKRTNGLIFSQRVLLALVDKGLTRERAYELVQRNAMECWQTGRGFKELLKSDKDVMDYLTTDELEELFDYSYYLRHIDEIYSRFGL